MIMFAFFLIAGLGLIVASRWLKFQETSLRVPAMIGGAVIILFAFVNTSFVIVGSNEVGHLKKVYGTKELPAGMIIATAGERGFQSRILSPGFKVEPLINLIYDVEMKEILEVPKGECAILTARDGVPLRIDQYIADGWKPGTEQNMIDAAYFLTEGKGQKGPQLNTLPPGKYRLNLYLWDTKTIKATEVKAGFVGVVKSNVGGIGEDWISPKLEEKDTSLSVPLVRKGGVGVWDVPLYPGVYYLNSLAYTIYPVDTRMFMWKYKGGYTKRTVNLTIQADGSIDQKEEKTKVPVPKDAAADAIVALTSDNWELHIEYRIQGQVKPEDAPFLVASVGTIKEAENKVATPVLRSESRNKVQEVHASAFMEKRALIEDAVERIIVTECAKAGVTITDLRMGDPNIPPELLLAGKREDLALKMQDTFKQEKKAQQERVATERERALADQQPDLVRAEIAKQASVLYKQTQQNKGEADANYLKMVAEGQAAQLEVLGKENVYNLEYARLVLKFATEHPELVKMPQVLVEGGGEGTGLAGAAAILGHSNLTDALTRGRPRPVTGR